MRYNPATDRAIDLDVLVETNRRIIQALVEPEPLHYIWCPEKLSYVLTWS